MAKLTQTAQSIKLSTAQALVVSAAAQRSEGVILLPDRIKGRAATVMVESFVLKGLVREIRAKPGMPVWRQDKESGRSFAIVITKLGRAVSAQINLADAATLTPSAQSNPESQDGALFGSAERASASPVSDAMAPRPTSKLAGVIALLTRDGGASVESLMAATGWLPHTTRAALTGLRKRGYALTRETHQGTSATYHIRLPPAAQAA